MLFTHYHNTPVGLLEISADESAVIEILFAETKHRPGPNRPETAEKSAAIWQCVRELDEYFAGERQVFSFPYRFEGTDFQVKVWQELEKIPYGTVISYGELARRVGNPKASRAVGLCNGNNPISITVPCHRVIGANGTLTGYGGDLWRKDWLLKHELKVSGKAKPEQLSLF